MAPNDRADLGIAVLGLLALAFTACSERSPCDDPASWEAAAAAARARSDARASEVTVAPVPAGATLEPRTPHLARLIVDTVRVDLDMAPAAPSLFPTAGTARERALALPPPIVTLYENAAGMLALPGEPDDQREVLPTLTLRLADLAHVEVLVSSAVEADTLTEALGALADQAGTRQADLVLGDGGGMVPLVLHRLWHDVGVAHFHDPLGDPAGLELVQREGGGVTMRTAGGTVGAGCEHLVPDTDFVSVPPRDGALDTASLTHCLDQLREAEGSLRHAYVLSDARSVAELVPLVVAVHAAHLEPQLVRYGLARPEAEPPSPLADVLRGGVVPPELNGVLAPGS